MASLEVGASFAQCVRAHHQGQITLRDFFARADVAIRNFSAAILHRWCAPPWVALDDMAQEYRVGCVWAFKHFDPTRPRVRPVEQYVFYNAGDKAKKWLHKQRGAKLHGNADMNPSRYEPLFVDVASRRSGGEDRDPADFCPALVAEPTQELLAQQKERWRHLLERAPTVTVRWGIIAMAGARGEEAEAARLLYADLAVRLRLRLDSELAAEEIISETVAYLRAA